MSNEIRYINSANAGTLFVARISQNGTQVGGLVDLMESSTIGGHYYGDFPTSNAAGFYIIEIMQGVFVVGDIIEFFWDGEKEVTPLSSSSESSLLATIRDHARAANMQTQSSV